MIARKNRKLVSPPSDEPYDRIVSIIDRDKHQGGWKSDGQRRIGELGTGEGGWRDRGWGKGGGGEKGREGRGGLSLQSRSLVRR